MHSRKSRFFFLSLPFFHFFFVLITIRFQSVFGKHVKLYTLGANEAVAKNKEKARVSIAVWLGEEKSQQVSECRLFLFSPSFFLPEFLIAILSGLRNCFCFAV